MSNEMDGTVRNESGNIVGYTTTEGNFVWGAPKERAEARAARAFADAQVATNEQAIRDRGLEM